ncbi:MAG: hypothetical protein NW208_17835 [Bryobacter sp.]|nr:hypothetical protein [Bryobacter sp.]
MRKVLVHAVWAVAMVLALVWGWTNQNERLKVEAEAGSLQAELSKAKSRGEAPVLPEKAAAPEAAATIPQRKAEAKLDVTPYLREIDDLRARLEAEQRLRQEAREEAATTAKQVEEGEAERKRLQEALRGAEEEVRVAGRLAEALQAELKQKTDRMLKAEQAEKVMQERLRKAETAQNRTVAAVGQMEDLNRQREAALVNLGRRFREVTDLLRRFSLEQSRAASGLGLQAGDLSRVQNAVEQAEEDLRQLRSLNARAEELAKRK